MEEEAPSRRSVAELAGRFKGSAPPHDAAGTETEKLVRRRPPRSLQLTKAHGDDQEVTEPPGVTSPLPGKVKRNSDFIEKLQANLALSPTALLPSPKSPGFRLLHPAFTMPSPGSTPVTMVTTTSTVNPTSPIAISPLTDSEGPTSFEDPPTAAEGSILPSINKGRARHSIRRRPPSRRHRKSSTGEEVGVASEEEDMPLNSPGEPEGKMTGRGEEQKGGGGGEEQKEEEDVEKGTTAAEEVKTEEEDQEKSSGEKQEEADGGEEKNEEPVCESSAR
ncbi:hypothetical protein PAMP_006540 [Pampus punctatissimus]